MKQRQRNVLIVCFVVVFGGLATFGAEWVLEHGFRRPYTEQSLRTKWQQDGTLASLRRWANHRIGGTSWGSTESQTIPTVTGGAHVFDVWPLKASSGLVSAVAITLGGADNHHGIIVGTKPKEFWFPIKNAWAEDTYWFDEVPDP